MDWLEKRGNGGRSQWIEYQVCTPNADQFSNGNQIGNGNQFSIEMEAESVTKKVTKSVTPIETVIGTDNNTVTDFDDFWSVYPRKEGKTGSEKTWGKLGDKDRQLAIEDCQIRFTNQERKFIPYGSTYLNQKRWVDESGVEQIPPRKEFQF
jgi:hypothetical protein